VKVHNNATATTINKNITLATSVIGLRKDGLLAVYNQVKSSFDIVNSFNTEFAHLSLNIIEGNTHYNPSMPSDKHIASIPNVFT